MKTKELFTKDKVPRDLLSSRIHASQEDEGGGLEFPLASLTVLPGVLGCSGRLRSGLGENHVFSYSHVLARRCIPEYKNKPENQSGNSADAEG